MVRFKCVPGMSLDVQVRRMSPAAWLAMDGQICNDCSTCRASEWSLATYLGPEKTNTVFKQRQYHFPI
jgi:hypothetical protein